MKTALITGITGQDGSYLAEFLLEKGYEVHGIKRWASTIRNTERIDHIYEDPHDPKRRLHLHYGDITDANSISVILEKVQPTEIYHLAALTHVKVSFSVPVLTAEVIALGTACFLEEIRRLKLKVKFYQAASSEMYGKVQENPQKETTPFYPRSPYACAKAYAFYLTRNYREAYGLFAANGILFNHESPRRGETFVTRKITLAAARIKMGLQQTLYLGNLDARRDWGYAPEYVEAIWKILQQPQADDFVIATGEAHSVQEFVEEAFGLLGLDWRKHVQVDPRYFRPSEVDSLQGDASKARRALGWAPRVNFKELVRIMVESDLERAEREAHAKKFPGQTVHVTQKESAK